jgi:hypothetical protein
MRLTRPKHEKLTAGSKVDEITFFADPALPGRFGLPEHI